MYHRNIWRYGILYRHFGGTWQLNKGGLQIVSHLKSLFIHLVNALIFVYTSWQPETTNNMKRPFGVRAAYAAFLLRVLQAGFGGATILNTLEEAYP